MDVDVKRIVLHVIAMGSVLCKSVSSQYFYPEDGGSIPSHHTMWCHNPEDRNVKYYLLFTMPEEKPFPNTFLGINFVATTANGFNNIIHSRKHMCDLSLAVGTFLDRLKRSGVRPLHKRKDKSEISNYKPFSLFAVFSKMFEKIVYKRVSHRLNSNNVLVNEPFGFRKDLFASKATYKFAY
jgi:hypothetical protein